MIRAETARFDATMCVTLRRIDLAELGPLKNRRNEKEASSEYICEKVF